MDFLYKANLIVLLISCFLNFLFIILAKKGISLVITDHFHKGPQKFHKSPTPRIGGLAVFIALSIGLLVYNPKLWLYFIVSLPIFLSGFIEDLTRSLHPTIRLALMSVGAAVAFFILDVKITKVDVPLIDTMLSMSLISFLFTTFALVGLSNAINIIDGFNGLASGVSIMILLAIAYVANQVGDFLIRDLSIMAVFALLGFFILNFPFGKIFLGDGGAYFIGFLIGVCSVLIVRNHTQVSPWFALVVNIYPVYETLFSIYRRRILRRRSAMDPDSLHLHTLIYRIFVKQFLKINAPEIRNPLTSVFLWVLNASAAVCSILFWDNTKALVICCAIFCIFYTYLYWKVLSLKSIELNKS